VIAPERSVGNLAVHGVDRLQATIKNRLESIQHRSDLLDGSSLRPA
jgi:hypothetical protein